MRLRCWIPISLCAVALVTNQAFAEAEFAPPAEGPVPFRRDKLPMDEDSISGLSRHLEIIARSISADTAANRRGAAQMLALALALDPGNGRARELVTKFSDGSHVAEAVGDQLEKSRARVWQSIGWLESSEAGANGHSLVNCLKDVMVIADPGHPKSQAIKTAGEKGAWVGWVRELQAFEPPRVVADDPKPEEPSENPGDPAENESPEIRLEKAQVGLVLWDNNGTNDHPKWTQVPATLGMKVETDHPENGHAFDRFTVSIGATDHWDTFASTNTSITRLLAEEHGNLPKISVVITSKELGESIASGRKQSLSAAAAVLASAAVTGVDPDAIILGMVDSSGDYKISTGFWNQIRALGKGTGRKLLIPSQAVPQMSALLAMENPSFFMDYEVLVANDFKQLLALSAKKTPDSLAPALEKFKEIRDRAAGKDLRQYIANSFIKQRLAEVSQLSPSHLSAKLLLVQAEGKRPTLIPGKVLASELRTAIEPMAWLSQKVEEDMGNSQISQLGNTYDTCRAAVEALDRYVEKNDRALIQQTRDLVLEIRSIERASRNRGETYMVREAIKSARRTLATRAKMLNEALNIAAGDASSP